MFEYPECFLNSLVKCIAFHLYLPSERYVYLLKSGDRQGEESGVSVARPVETDRNRSHIFLFIFLLQSSCWDVLFPNFRGVFLRFTSLIQASKPKQLNVPSLFSG